MWHKVEFIEHDIKNMLTHLFKCISGYLNKNINKVLARLFEVEQNLTKFYSPFPDLGVKIIKNTLLLKVNYYVTL